MQASGEGVEAAGEARRRHGQGARRPRRALTAALAGALVATPLAMVSATAGPLSAASAATATCTPALKPSSAELASTTGITKNSVTVGNVSIISGPVPGLFEGAPTGVKAYFAYINAKGGVNGRKLSVQSLDTGFSGEQNEQETQTAENSDFAMVGNFSLFDSYGCSVLATNTAFPDVSVTLDPGDQRPAQRLQRPAAGPGQRWRPAGLHPQEVPQGHQGRHDHLDNRHRRRPVERRAGGVGEGRVQNVYAQKVGPLTSNFTTEVIKMRDAGVNVV